MDIERYFEELKTGGNLESTGVFTLDPNRVQWKLAKFQLADSRLFPLFLVKAAVAGACSSLERDSGVTAGAPTTYYLHGLRFGREDVRSLHLAALGHGENEAAKFLMVAFSAATGMGNVKLTCCDNKDSFGLHNHDWEVEFHEDPPDRPNFCGTIFRFEPRGENVAFGSIFLRTRFSPVSLSYLRPGQFGRLGRDEISREAFAVALGPNLRPTADLAEDKQVVAFQAKAPEIVHLSWHTGEKSRVEGMYRGVLYPLGAEFQGEDLSGVIDCNDLKLDVSYTGFIDNAGYQAKLRKFRSLKSEFVDAVAKAPGRWKQPTPNSIRRLVEQEWGDRPLADLKGLFALVECRLLPSGEEQLQTFLRENPTFTAPVGRERVFRHFRSTATHARPKRLTYAQQRAEDEMLFCEATKRDRKDSRELLAALALLKSSPGEESPMVGGAFVRLEQAARGLLPLSEVELPEAHPSWTGLLSQVITLESGDSARLEELLLDQQTPQALQACALLDLGRAGELYSRVTRSQSHLFRDLSSFWFTELRSFFRGQVKWSQQNYMVASSTLLLSHQREATRLLSSVRRLRVQDPLLGLTNQAIFHRSFWPLLVAFRHTEFPQPKQRTVLWSRLLIQAAIGPPGNSNTMEENLREPLQLPLLAIER